MELQPLVMPPELIRAIAAHGGQPIRLEDPVTSKIFWLIEEQPTTEGTPGETALDPNYVERMLDEGIAAMEAGQVVAWDPERIKSMGRRLLAERQSKTSS